MKPDIVDLLKRLGAWYCPYCLEFVPPYHGGPPIDVICKSCWEKAQRKGFWPTRLVDD